MIAYISGKVIDKDEESLIVSNGGVGWRIFVKDQLLSSVEVDADLEIWVSEIYKKDSGSSLYGFEHREERLFFETLTNISGVGPKTALSIISIGTPNEIATMIAQGDYDSLSNAKKVSKKLAERIIVELKNTVKNEKVSPEYREVFEALVALGYRKQEAREAAMLAVGDNVSEKIKDALSKVSKV